MKLAPSLIIVVAAELAAIAPGAEPDGLDAVLNRLERNVAAIRTVDTEFVQEKSLAVLKQKLVLHGRACIRKPEHFAWHVTQPTKFSMSIIGTRLRQWDAETGRTQKINLEKNVAFQAAAVQMRRWLSGDYAALRSNYTVELLSTNPVALRFVPMAGDAAEKFIASVTVSFRQDERYIDSLEIAEPGGDTTRLRFVNTVLNEELPDSVWQIPPPGE